MIASLAYALMLSSCEKNPLDSGNHTDWARINSGLGSYFIQDLAIDPHDVTTLYAATYGGIYKSSDSGDHWSECGNGITSDDIKCIQVSPFDANLLVCGTWGQGIFISHDCGNTWQSSSTGITNPRVNEIEFDPQDSDKLYAACADMMFKSINGGETWEICFSYGNVRSVAIHPLQPESLFVGVEFHGIFRSYDDGASWQKTSTGLHNTEDGYAGPYDIVFDPLQPTLLYAATYTVDIYKSVNGGESWALRDRGLDYRKVREISLDPRYSQILIAATDRGVMLSSDSGETWQPLDSSLNEEGIRAIAVSNAKPRTIYAGTYGGGVFRYVWSN